MMIFFSHLSLFNRWNILKIWENLSKWNMDVGPSHLRAFYVLTTYIYAHHVSYVRAPYASNVGDVPEFVCPVHICEAMRWLSHTWSGWDVFWEVHRITWLFSKKVWERAFLRLCVACSIKRCTQKLGMILYVTSRRLRYVPKVRRSDHNIHFFLIGKKKKKTSRKHFEKNNNNVKAQGFGFGGEGGYTEYGTYIFY